MSAEATVTTGTNLNLVATRSRAAEMWDGGYEPLDAWAGRMHDEKKGRFTAWKANMRTAWKPDVVSARCCLFWLAHGHHGNHASAAAWEEYGDETEWQDEGCSAQGALCCDVNPRRRGRRFTGESNACPRRRAAAVMAPLVCCHSRTLSSVCARKSCHYRMMTNVVKRRLMRDPANRHRVQVHSTAPTTHGSRSGSGSSSATIP